MLDFTRHCHMQDTVDEAIQRLYRACKQNACFPGVLPSETGGHATTANILQGMGFANLDLGPGRSTNQEAIASRVLLANDNSNTGPINSPRSSISNSPDGSHVLYSVSDNSSNSVDFKLATEPRRLYPEFTIPRDLHGLDHQQPQLLSATDQFQSIIDGQTDQQHHHQHWQLPHPYFVMQTHNYAQYPDVFFAAASEMGISHPSSHRGDSHTSTTACKHQDRPSIDPQCVWIDYDGHATVAS